MSSIYGNTQCRWSLLISAFPYFLDSLLSATFFFRSFLLSKEPAIWYVGLLECSNCKSILSLTHASRTMNHCFRGESTKVRKRKDELAQLINARLIDVQLCHDTTDSGRKRGRENHTLYFEFLKECKWTWVVEFFVDSSFLSYSFWPCCSVFCVVCVWFSDWIFMSSLSRSNPWS